ncbi:chromosome partitioning protein [Cellulomonas sp. DKR-3]|uniref:Chromosome partitioning protein n=1 Tax=Cellulomonas fulva TaxID=2835530 RepID=A0ABS5TVQ2_9CELL|nr:chromosome partitioning protein [Cellulomonas fulva]MBT0993244.1 chromosome partitioning protein [Cellulomonas fulva]
MSEGDGTTTAARLPQVTAEVHDDGTGQISVDGVVERIRMASLQEAGAAITERIAALAGEVGSPVPVQVRDPDGMWSLLIHPDGLVDEAPADGGSARVGEPGAGPVATSGEGPDEPAGDGSRADAGAGTSDRPGGFPSEGTTSHGTASDRTASEGTASEGTATGATPGSTPTGPAAGGPGSATSSAAAPATRSSDDSPAPGATSPTSSSLGAGAAASTRASEGRESLPTLDDLLAARHPSTTGPAEHGWRVGVRRATFGAVKPGPGRAEKRRRVQTAAVRRTFDGPRTVVVINPKGGAHKTTATMLLAATFGLQRGGYTLAWDNNETRGTLGWRSAHTDHQRTAVDLLQAMPSLGGAATVRVGDLDGYVRTQTAEQFDVLASDESSSSATSMDAAAFASLHRVLSRFYRVLVIDTGNNMRASNWQEAVDAADQVVVVSTIREDTAQSAAWALDALRASGREDAVRSAVTILSAPDRKIDKDLRKRLRAHFGALTRAVVEVPYDPSLVPGGPIDYEVLRPATRDAWLRATAVVADGL